MKACIRRGCSWSVIVAAGLRQRVRRIVDRVGNGGRPRYVEGGKIEATADLSGLDARGIGGGGLVGAGC